MGTFAIGHSKCKEEQVLLTQNRAEAMLPGSLNWTVLLRKLGLSLELSDQRVGGDRNDDKKV